MGRYDDIIDLPHKRSQHRTPMPMENRAAQFAPFAALTGHDEAISETARLTEVKIELTDEEKSLIQLALIKSFEEKIPVKIIYFKPDNRKAGGSYSKITGIVKKIDGYDKTVTLIDGNSLKLEDIISVST